MRDVSESQDIVSPVRHWLSTMRCSRNAAENGALHCLGPQPLFNDRQFDVMFRISRSRFQRLMEDVAATGKPFYLKTRDLFNRKGSSIEAKLLLPLKTLAYGVPPHTFRDYFQQSTTLARKCVQVFVDTVFEIYKEEYLRCPTRADLRNILNLHKEVHGVYGMVGSLDCMHSPWKNCPMAWQGSYLGAKGHPTIVLEAACDHNLWFWHAAHGYAGSLTDKTILSLSPLLDNIVNGKFSALEAGLVPFTIEGEQFDKTWFLCDSAYPDYSRFVTKILEPLTEQESKFTAWQESARKDIERGFGVFQSKLQYVARPIHDMHLATIAVKFAACMIIHNMCVSDRVMEDVRARYNPSNGTADFDVNMEAPPDLHVVQGRQLPARLVAAIGGDAVTFDEMERIVRREEWRVLDDKHEHIRLRAALMRKYE